MPAVDGGAAARWLWYLGTFAVIGAAGFRVVAYRATRELAYAGQFRNVVSRAARRLGLTGAGLILLGEALRLYVQARSFLDPDEAVTIQQIRQILNGTEWGTGWSAQVYVAMLTAAGLLIAGKRARAGWSLATVGAIGLAMTVPLTGHAMSGHWPVALTLPLQGIHVLAGSLWLGTLLGLMVAGFAAASDAPPGQRVALLAELVNAFSPLALIGAAGAITAGALLSWAYIGSWAGLVGSDYGRVLLVKLGLLALVMIAGAYNWRRLRPRLVQPDGAARLRRSAGLELLAGALLLAVTAILSALSAPAV